MNISSTSTDLSNNIHDWDNPEVLPENRSWATGDFVAHYFLGNGREIQLADVGLDQLFEQSSSVEKPTNQFITNIINEPRTDSQKGISDVTSEPRLFAIGNSTLFMQSNCSDQTCTFNFSIQDRFSDPLDITDSTPGEDEIGIPYSITHQWTTTREIP